MKKVLILTVAVMTLCLSACNNDSPQEPVTDGEQTSGEQNGNDNTNEEIVVPTFTDPESLTLDFNETEYAAADAINNFGVDFFAYVCKDSTPGQNLLVSPLSVSIFLSMLSNICNEEDVQNICNTLGYNNITGINDVCRKLLVCLPKVDEESTLALNNALWYDNKYTIHPVFNAIMQQYYNSDVFDADFAKQRNAATDAINKWVADKTYNKIPRLIDQLPGETVAFLINALYFKAKWSVPFPTGLTGVETFRGANGNTNVDMMHSSDWNLHKTDNYTAVSHTFGNNYSKGFKAMFVLPNDETDKLVNIDADQLKAILKSEPEKNCKTSLSLPRFELNPDESIDITETLIKYGIVNKLSIAGNKLFTETVPSNMLIKHRANISFNEEGAEGSAATYGIMTSISDPNIKIVSVKFDRPFIFVIYETFTGNCIFAGRCNNI